MSKSITTLTFFRYPTLSGKLWAFGQMQFAHAQLQRTPGLQFYKLMGSGKGDGFNPLPDWEVYALLSVWTEEAAAQDFFEKSQVYLAFQAHSTEQWTVFLRTRQAKGLWSGGNPFTPSSDIDENNPLIAVITRATIRWRRMADFWRYVPTSQKPIVAGCPGLLFTKGIGEAPLVQMATFSLWNNLDSLKAFAYQSAEHRVAIEKTRQLDWYKEEMFVRFQPYRSVGTWQGRQVI